MIQRTHTGNRDIYWEFSICFNTVGVASYKGKQETYRIGKIALCCRYFTKMELRDLFMLDNPRVSTTQRQIEELHAHERKTDCSLDAHIAFLLTLGNKWDDIFCPISVTMSSIKLDLHRTGSSNFFSWFVIFLQKCMALATTICCLARRQFQQKTMNWWMEIPRTSKAG